MRETIGEVICPFQNVEAEVRRDKNGKLYYYCDGCGGPVIIHGRSFQEWMLSNARIYRAEEIEA